MGGWVIATAGWQPAVLLIGLPAIVVALAILATVREAGVDRAAALARGSTWTVVRSLRGRARPALAVRRVIGRRGRPRIGVVTTFVPLYLSLVLGLDAPTIAVMYTLLLIGSVPGPLVAGRFADRLGHRPVLIVTYASGRPRWRPSCWSVRTSHWSGWRSAS